MRYFHQSPLPEYRPSIIILYYTYYWYVFLETASLTLQFRFWHVNAHGSRTHFLHDTNTYREIRHWNTYLYFNACIYTIYSYVAMLWICKTLFIFIFSSGQGTHGPSESFVVDENLETFTYLYILYICAAIVAW